jgi:ferredoxin-NADP reductase/ferredoxin
MNGPDPVEFGWWLASRAAGIVALLCIAISVGIGLAMAGRVSRRAELARTLLGLHQQTALIGLVAIAVHGITLLGDRFMSPSLGDIALPFTSAYEPLWTGLGVTGGWLAAILGLSYWIRDRIGPRLWRKLHRATILVYVLSVAHALGAGTDASEPWMLALLVATGAPILFLFVMRVLTPPAGPPFLRYRVAAVTQDSASVRSFELVPARGKRMPAHEPGQFVTVRTDVPDAGRIARSYSLSRTADDGRLRISVKRERGGLLSEHLHGALGSGAAIELAGPSGGFLLDGQGTSPIVLISAGIGATPVLAMLQALAAEESQREVWWIHSARNGREHAFRDEVDQHLARLRHGHRHLRYTRPDGWEVPGRDFDAEGRITTAVLLDLDLPLHAEYRLCGPRAFVADLEAGLLEAGVDAARLAHESFGGASAAQPSTRPSAPPSPPPANQALSVAFSRSRVTAPWDPRCANLLEFAEATGVAAPSGCRVGACHECRAPVLEGAVRHDPEPAAAPSGSALLCCAVPQGDLVLDA